MIPVAIAAVVSLADPLHLVAVVVLGLAIRPWPWAAGAGAAAGVASVFAFADAHSPMVAAILIGRPLALGIAAGLISWAAARWRRAKQARAVPTPGVDVLAALRKDDGDKAG